MADWPDPEPTLAERMERRRAQRQIAILLGFGLPLGVFVGGAASGFQIRNWTLFWMLFLLPPGIAFLYAFVAHYWDRQRIRWAAGGYR